MAPRPRPGPPDARPPCEGPTGPVPADPGAAPQLPCRVRVGTASRNVTAASPRVAQPPVKKAASDLDVAGHGERTVPRCSDPGTGPLYLSWALSSLREGPGSADLQGLSGAMLPRPPTSFNIPSIAETPQWPALLGIPGTRSQEPLSHRRSGLPACRLDRKSVV